MESDFQWFDDFQADIQYGYVDASAPGHGHFSPQLVLNKKGTSVQQTLLRELDQCESFTFSVAFVTPSAIAQLKQYFLDFPGQGYLITSTFQDFNEPRAFAELLALSTYTNIRVRRHTANGFHPKGYVFQNRQSLTALIGSSNLTISALSSNHEWNLKVSASRKSDLANQLAQLLEDEVNQSEPITKEWIDEYASTYNSKYASSSSLPDPTETTHLDSQPIEPNSMQRDALRALANVREHGQRRALIISATGTGKTMLSALDVRSFAPKRLLFVVHREQILDRTIQEYRRVLGGSTTDYGKLTGGAKQMQRRYMFATIQTLSKKSTLAAIDPKDFDYVIIDEAHRCGSQTYRRVLNHLDPSFLLGMTATPERTDGFNVFELFDYNVPYEIRLNDALDAEILCPFHYYGVADITFDDGTTTTDATHLTRLISSDRVNHLLDTLEKYVQSGIQPRGLVFCSRKDEAAELSAEMNRRSLHGSPLRTVALTGDDSVHYREACVKALEAGELDYILTVDVFNEGVDIPSLNQVIMLRKTESAIVFVQQMGRGLRLSEGKDYVVVVDFIGNYENNFLIPIALFGSGSLNKEEIIERVQEAPDPDSVPGPSSVSFDKPSREAVTRSIRKTALDSLPRLKAALTAMQRRVGGTPRLWDFYRFQSVDAVLLATKLDHYPALCEKLLKTEHGLTSIESRSLALLSHEVMNAKRLQEFVLLDELLSAPSLDLDLIRELFAAHGLPNDESSIDGSIATLTMRGFPSAAKKRYESGIAVFSESRLSLTTSFRQSYEGSQFFRQAVDDARTTGWHLTSDRFDKTRIFTPGAQYTRKDVAHLVGWDRASASTIYGMRTDYTIGIATIFVTLHKPEDIALSTAYGDQLLDPSMLLWFSKSRRTLTSADVAPIVNGEVVVHVFVKKDNADGAAHYYLGQGSAKNAIQKTMMNEQMKELPVVQMQLKLDTPMSQGLFDYFVSPEPVT